MINEGGIQSQVQQNNTELSELKMMFQQLMVQSKSTECKLNANNQKLEKQNGILKKQNGKLEKQNGMLEKTLKQEKKKTRKIDRQNRRRLNTIKTEKADRIRSRNAARAIRRAKKQRRKLKRDNDRTSLYNKLYQDYRDEWYRAKRASKGNENKGFWCAVGAVVSAASVPITGPVGVAGAAAFVGGEASSFHSASSVEYPSFDSQATNQEVKLRYPSSDEYISDDEQIPARLLDLDDVSSSSDDDNIYPIFSRVPLNQTSITTLTQ